MVIPSTIFNGLKFDCFLYFKILGSPFFILGFQSGNNVFTHEIVTSRYKYIYTELKKRGIELICTGSDGDTRYLKSQKHLAQFGSFKKYKELTLVGNFESKILGYQDPLHLAKKLSNTLFDNGNTLKLGNFSASLGHLIIVYKSYTKIDHNLTLSDLDYVDKMNYKYVVINLVLIFLNCNAFICFFPFKLIILGGLRKLLILKF